MRPRDVFSLSLTCVQVSERIRDSEELWRTLLRWHAPYLPLHWSISLRKLLFRMPNLWATALLTDLMTSVGVEYWLPIAEPDFADIVRWLPANKRLSSLEFDRVGLADAQLEAISEAIAAHGAVLRLHVKNNPKASSFDVFLRLSSLKILNLQGNDIDDVKVVQISKGLETNKSLTHLYLCNNAIGDSGVTALAYSLAKNTTLRVLGLTDNRFGTRGVQAFVECLTENKTLQSLDLDSNDASDDLVSAVKKVLRARRAAALVAPVGI